jgi:diguanylate cyclase (GGDEF)-like protein
VGLYRHSLSEAEMRIKFDPDEMRKIYTLGGINDSLKWKETESKLFDPRTRPWYIAGLQAANDKWTSVYVDFKTRELVATRARKVPALASQDSGVVGTDMSLRALNDFVRKLNVSEKGLAFIVEPNGDLIASSVSENVKKLSNGEYGRLSARDSGNALLSHLYHELESHLKDINQSDKTRSLMMKNPQGEWLHLAFSRVQDAAGLDWIAVVAMPVSDYMGTLSQLIWRSVAIALLALIVSALIGCTILNWVARDMRKLSRMAKDIGEGRFENAVQLARKDELGQLSESLHTMRLQLQTDVLTGLDNRETFSRKVKHRIASRPMQSFAILFVDLNQFKAVNDSMGHAVGDEVLTLVAKRLGQFVHAEDLTARYAGDEFVLLIDNAADTAATEYLKHRLIDLLSQPLSLSDGKTLQVPMSASVGGSHYPTQGDSVTSLLKIADKDMYDDKRNR